MRAMSPRLLRIALCGSALVATLGAPRARGDLLPIVNPSFENVSRPLLVGEQSNGAGGAAVPVGTRFPFGGGPPGVLWDNPVEIPGWRTHLRPFGDPAPTLAGVLNPPLIGGQPFITGQDGQNVAAVQILQMGQTLNTQLAANTRYHLDFLGGIGRFGTPYILNISLLAVDDLDTLPIEGQPGVARLTITQGLVPPPETFGTLLPCSLTYTTPPVLPSALEGRYLGIQLWGSDGLPRVVYDDLRLDAVPVPEPGGTSAWVLTAAWLGQRLRRRR